MSSGIELLLSDEKLHASLPLTGATSLYKTFQALFLIECPNDDATALQNIQLNAAFLEHLTTQRASKVQELLRAWHSQKIKAEAKGLAEDGKDQVRGGIDLVEEEEMSVEYTDREILDEIEEFIRDGVNEVCVYFEGQEVEAVVRMEEVKKKVERILDQGTSWFWPKIICQPRDVV